MRGDTGLGWSQDHPFQELVDFLQLSSGEKLGLWWRESEVGRLGFQGVPRLGRAPRLGGEGAERQWRRRGLSVN